MATLQKQQPKAIHRAERHPPWTAPPLQELAPDTSIGQPAPGVLQRAVADPRLVTPANVRFLQRAYGNRAATALLVRSPASRAAPGRPQATVQRKLGGDLATDGKAKVAKEIETRFGVPGKPAEAMADQLDKASWSHEAYELVGEIIEARKKLIMSGIAAPYWKRGVDLIFDPDKLDQTAFGICGLVSILRPMVAYTPTKFADLAISALTDSAFVTKWSEVFTKGVEKSAKEERKEVKEWRAEERAKTMGPLTQKQSSALESTEKQYLQEIEQRLAKNKQTEFDFIVSQWLLRKQPSGKVTQTALKFESQPSGPKKSVIKTKTKDWSTVFQSQVDFTKTFDNPGEGDFAMTSGGLNYLLSAVAGVKSLKIKIQDFATDFATAKSFTQGKGMVLASVTDADFIQETKPIKVAPKRPAQKFEHWIILDNVTKSGPNMFKLDIWTWANKYTVSMAKWRVNQYFYSFVTTRFGQ